MQQKNWVFDMYGQVERGRNEPASNYQRTINSLLQQLPDRTTLAVSFITTLAAIVLLIIGKLRSGIFCEKHLFLLLLIAVQAVILVCAILQGGTVGSGKSLHLATSVSLSQILALFIFAPQLLGRNNA